MSTCKNNADVLKLNRREFMSIAGATSVGMILSGPTMPAMAGPFENDYRKVIPADKKLSADWIRSLYEQGNKDVYTDPAALRHIGMPVGGLFAGTVYLSGDGRLWLLDIFNRDQEGIAPREVDCGGRKAANRDGANYIEPAPLQSPFKQGFFLEINGERRSLDLTGFSGVAFEGRYPIGRVTFRDAGCPVAITLDAFSPFIPLHTEDSSLPATVMQYTLTNTTSRAVTASIGGFLQNAVCLDSNKQYIGIRTNSIVTEATHTALLCSAHSGVKDSDSPRPDILFEDFERSTYENWTVEGTAFGEGPIAIADVPGYQGNLAGRGQRVVNSHASAPVEGVIEKDRHTGTLTSRPFTIERKTIRFLIGGGAYPGQTCINLLLDGAIVMSVSGQDNNRMEPRLFHVQPLEGKKAQLQIVDHSSGGWGNIGIDEIVFSDRPIDPPGVLEEQRDHGTMALSLLGNEAGDSAAASASDPVPQTTATAALQGEPVGQIIRRLTLDPGQTQTVVFCVTWHFPNFYARGVGNINAGHSYASRFKSALDVARYLAVHRERLIGRTRQWVQTWYDSSLPHWLLDRTMANTSTLATTTCYRFRDGRFWAWEGIGCCEGTCTHVWHYAQAPGRLFPEIERVERERVNFGIGLHADGGIGMRTNLTESNQQADDGQCGRILGVYRDHQMSADSAFLTRLWPNVKRAIRFMIQRDANSDGILEGAQHNTLDAAWYGKISFISSLYLAALKAGERMAAEMGDDAFAGECQAIAQRGEKNILEMYNGEYFIQIEDPRRKDEVGTGDGCYIDQVFGQTWAYWVNLGVLFDREKQCSALRALWTYNFVPDIGAFRKAFTPGRWYAMAGDAGLVMCTWPTSEAKSNEKHWQAGYFNECMSGFEWQAASHMIWEGLDHPDLLEKGLAVSRAIHDRYNAALRNPYNEIECSDHYARAMASYGVFQAVCGFNCHGPHGHIEFAPRLTPENFKAAFVTAQGWGSYRQRADAEFHRCEIEVRDGVLRLNTLAFAARRSPADLTVTRNGEPVKATFVHQHGRLQVRLDHALNLKENDTLHVIWR